MEIDGTRLLSRPKVLDSPTFVSRALAGNLLETAITLQTGLQQPSDSVKPLTNMNASPSTTMSSRTARRGHAAVAAILTNMDRYLPSDTINRQDYRRCRTVYGLMNTAYRRIDDSEQPGKEYKDLQGLETELRTHLNNLNAAKGIPSKMREYLDELRDAVNDALARGISTEFLLEGVTDMIDGNPNSQTHPQPKLAKMMPDTKYKKVCADLAEAKKKIQKLNEENNALTMRVKRLDMERDRLSRWRRADAQLGANADGETQTFAEHGNGDG